MTIDMLMSGVGSDENYRMSRSFTHSLTSAGPGEPCRGTIFWIQSACYPSSAYVYKFLTCPSLAFRPARNSLLLAQECIPSILGNYFERRSKAAAAMSATGAIVVPPKLNLIAPLLLPLPAAPEGNVLTADQW